jgi:hypothetical protein
VDHGVVDRLACKGRVDPRASNNTNTHTKANKHTKRKEHAKADGPKAQTNAQTNQNKHKKAHKLGAEATQTKYWNKNPTSETRKQTYK